MDGLTGAQSALARCYLPLARSIAWKARGSSEDPDDVNSDALLGLVLAARRFDPSRAGFATYARVMIGGAIRRGRKQRSGLPRTLYYSAERPETVPLNARDPAGIEYQDRLAAPREDPDLRMDVSSLPTRERLVLGLYWRWGLSQTEIGALLGVSQMQVSRINQQALARLR